MVQTKKFSQFDGPQPILPTDIVVGLRNGDNFQFTGVGSGGSGTGITRLIQQPNHGLQPGDWIRLDSLGNYVKALADTAQNAEIEGTVLSDASFTPNQFTIQVVGYVDTGTFTGLTVGSVYFLSDVTPGLMQLAEPVTNGFVSLPLFIATSTTAGWIRQFRGFINGGQPGAQGGGENPNIVVVNQPAHGLNEGQAVRLNGPVDYVAAKADNLGNAQAIGFVIEDIDTDHFALQTGGYTLTPPLLDDLGNPLVPGTVYYLSFTVAGGISLTNPSSVGQASKPMYIPEQISPPINAGYILEQRPDSITAANVSPNIVNINQVGHGLAVGDWVYISASLTYTKGIATSLATSQVVGVVIAVTDANNFILQTDGYNVGAVTVDELGNPVVPGSVYYLSSTMAGKITLTAPSSAGLYTKPLFNCEQTFGMTGVYAGYVMEQRPLPFNAASPSIVNINQVAHGLTKGQVVRLNSSITYVPAQANSLANSQAVGVVLSVTDANNFVLQTEGYSTNAITVDALGNPVVPASVYYLSATVAGAVTATAPVTIGQVTKPIFICEQQSVGNTSGYVLPQRPLLITSATANPNIVDITQLSHGFVAGDWLYISGFVGANPTYSKGIATTLATSQVVGVVINVIDVNNFTLQDAGYNIGAVTTDDLGNPILQSRIYYLSTLVAGKITNIEPIVTGQFTKPLYASEQTLASTGTTAGYILEQRPLDVSESDNDSIVTISQAAHGLIVGDVVRLSASVTYIRAIASSLANAQAVGVVIQVINVNTFVLQTEGYVTNAITLDAAGAVLVPATVYYLSPTVAGKVTATAPSTIGQATKPMFICEQAGVSPAGYIMPQRPLAITAGSTNTSIVTVTQPGHAFIVGDWIYVSGFSGANPVYSKGIATSLATSQVVGVVIQVISASQFVLQTEGYNTGSVTTDATGAPIVQSNVYYLSASVAGKLTSTAPATVGQFTKPLYTSEQTLATTGINAGYVLPQRPLSVGSGGGGGGGYQLITNITLTNAQTVPILGAFTGYKDIRIVGENIVFVTLSNGSLQAARFQMQYELSGAVQTNQDYRTSLNGGKAGGGAPGITGVAMPLGTLGNQAQSGIYLTPTPSSYNFVCEMLGINNSNLWTMCNITSLNFSTAAAGFQALAGIATSGGVYITNTNPCTGVIFNFRDIGLYAIQSGLISVYGVPI